MNPGPDRRAGTADGSATRPAAMCQGPGHVVVHGNAAFRAVFGADCVGLPAREGLVSLPAVAFSVLDAVFERGRPGARWIRMDDREWRLTAAPRRIPGSDDVYGVALHLRERTDLPVIASDVSAGGDPR